MAEIVVIDPGHVTVDGEPVGSIFDVAWNRPQFEGIQSLVLSALQTWLEARDQTNRDALAAQAASHADEVQALKDHFAADSEALKASHAADLQRQAEHEGNALAELQAKCDQEARALADQHAATVAQLNTTCNGLLATIAELNIQIEALGGTELGKRLAAEQTRRKLEAKIAELNAELAAMDQPAS